LRDPVDRVIEERRALDRGFGNSVTFSVVSHFLVVGAAFGAQFVLPHEPPIQVADGIAIELPRGGGGTPNVEPPAPSQKPEPDEQPEASEPPKVLKPPPPEKRPEPTRGLPAPDAKPAPTRKPAPATPPPGTGLSGRGTGQQTPGLEFAPPGPGIPSGVDRHGDWYLAGVQRKIWMIWTQQIHSGQKTTVRVQFTIHSDGRVSDVRIVERSGAALLDLAAQRAVVSAGPFGPFPQTYGQQKQITIQANFTPTG